MKQAYEMGESVQTGGLIGAEILSNKKVIYESGFIQIISATNHRAVFRISGGIGRLNHGSARGRISRVWCVFG